MLKDYLKVWVVMSPILGLIAFITLMTTYYAGTYQYGLPFAIKIIVAALLLPIIMGLVQVGLVQLVIKIRMRFEKSAK